MKFAHRWLNQLDLAAAIAAWKRIHADQTRGIDERRDFELAKFGVGLDVAEFALDPRQRFGQGTGWAGLVEKSCSAGETMNE